MIFLEINLPSFLTRAFQNNKPNFFVQGEAAREVGGKNVTTLDTFAALSQYHFCPWPKRDIWRPGEA